jgi:hypothetical protein
VKKMFVALLVALTMGAVVATPSAASAADCWGAAIATFDDGRAPVKVCAANPVTGPSANSFHDCFGNYLCLWTEESYTGQLYQYPNYSDGRCITFTTGLKNNAESYRSRLTNPSNHVATHRSSGCGDTFPFGINPDQYNFTLPNPVPTVNMNNWESVDYGG